MRRKGGMKESRGSMVNGRGARSRNRGLRTVTYLDFSLLERTRRLLTASFQWPLVSFSFPETGRETLAEV